jgi:hypothetical protein
MLALGSPVYAGPDDRGLEDEDPPAETTEESAGEGAATEGEVDAEGAPQAAEDAEASPGAEGVEDSRAAEEAAGQTEPAKTDQAAPGEAADEAVIPLDALPTEAPKWVEVDPRDRPDGALRVFAELGMGLLVGVLVGGVTLLAVVPGSGDRLSAVILGGGIGVGIGIPAGVLLGGHIAGGVGSAWSPWVGFLLGGVVGGLFVVLAPPVGVPMLVALPITGAIVAYELSDSANMDELLRPKRAELYPIVLVDEHTFGLGFSGSF